MNPEGSPMMPAEAAPKGMPPFGRPKWSHWVDGRLAVAACTVNMSDFVITHFLPFSGAGVLSLLVYLLFLALVGLPVMLLEVWLGQAADRGTLRAWKAVPLFRGIGYVMTMMNGHMAWVAFWTLMALWRLFWDIGQTGGDVATFGCNGTSGINGSYRHCSLRAGDLFSDRWPYWDGSPTDIDFVNVALMALAMLLVCGLCSASIRVKGKIFATCLVVPHLLMLMVFVKTMTLPGAAQALQISLHPDVYRLASASVWAHSCAMALSTMGGGHGLLITAGSYNRFNNNLLIDCLIALVLKVVMGIVIVLTTIGLFGFVAFQTNVALSDAMEGGLGTVPVVAVALLSSGAGGTFWTFCYLCSVMLVTLNAALWTVEATVAAVWDLLPPTPRFGTLRRRPVLMAVFAVPWFFWGIAYCSRAGLKNISQLEAFWVSDRLTLLVALLECAAVGWTLGQRRLRTGWTAAAGRCCSVYPLLFWAVITPIALLVCLGLSWTNFSLSDWDLSSLGGFVFNFLVVFVSGVVIFARRPGSLSQKWRSVTSPEDLSSPLLLPRNYADTGVPMATVSA